MDGGRPDYRGTCEVGVTRGLHFQGRTKDTAPQALNIPLFPVVGVTDSHAHRQPSEKPHGRYSSIGPSLLSHFSHGNIGASRAQRSRSTT